MKKTLFTALFGWFILETSAQSDVDALRYSSTPALGTTARSIGLGGAVGALGADVSAVVVNPAGLAQFKTSQFSLSLGTLTNRNEASYGTSPTVASNLYRGDIPNISLLFTTRKTQRGNPNKKGWVNSNFMLSYNRTANFNRSISYQQNRPVNSMTDYVAEFSGGTNASELDANEEQLREGFYYFENMFWYTYLIDSVSNGNYTSVYDRINGTESQKGSVSTRGGSGEYNIAYAANYEHKIYFGGSFNIHTVNFTETNRFSEVNDASMFGGWDQYSFTRNLETSGYGFSGRLGATLRPNDNVRIGATLHTPTRLILTDNYFDELFVTRSDGTTDDLRTIDKEFSYDVVTPARYSVQAAYIFGKQGLVTAEIETMDFSTMNLSTEDNYFEKINISIADKYKRATTLKLGAEYVMNSFILRGGFASVGNPMVKKGNQSRRIASAGFGIQEKEWAFDFALASDVTKDQYVPYQRDGLTSGAVDSKFRNTRLMLTIGKKF